MKLVYLQNSNGPAKINWELSKSGELIGEYAEDFNLPKGITLTKVQ